MEGPSILPERHFGYYRTTLLDHLTINGLEEEETYCLRFLVLYCILSSPRLTVTGGVQDLSSSIGL
jgi:hypothetical protein